MTLHRYGLNVADIGMVFLVGLAIGLALSPSVGGQTQMVPSHEQSTWPTPIGYHGMYSTTPFTDSWWGLVNALVNCNILAAGGYHTCVPVTVPAMSYADLNNTYWAVSYCTEHPSYCYPGTTNERPHPTGPLTTIHMVSYYTQGPEIYGMYIVLLEGGHVVKTGYTPITFTVQQGVQYEVQADDYRGIHFVSWAYPPTSEDPLLFTNSGNTTAQLEAMYS